MKQPISKRKMKQCSSIIGQTVMSAFANGGDLPHHVLLAWTSPTTAYLVNIKKRRAKKYVEKGHFVMKRLLLPLKFWVDYNSKNGLVGPYLDSVDSEFYYEKADQNFVDKFTQVR